MTAPEPAPETIGAQVTRRRAEQGQTQTSLAVAAGLPRWQTVQDVERGGNATLATLQALADALGAPLVIHPGAAPPQRQDGARQRRARGEE